MTYHSRLFSDAAPIGTLVIRGDRATVALRLGEEAGQQQIRPLGVILASVVAALRLALS